MTHVVGDGLTPAQAFEQKVLDAAGAACFVSTLVHDPFSRRGK